MASWTDDLVGAHVEIVEVDPGAADLPCIKPRRVFVNGADVGLLTKGGVQFESTVGDPGATVVVLRLLPRSVTIYAREPLDEEKNQ